MIFAITTNKKNCKQFQVGKCVSVQTKCQTQQIVYKLYKTKKFDARAEQWRTEQEIFGKFKITFPQILGKAKRIEQIHCIHWIQNETFFLY